MKKIATLVIAALTLGACSESEVAVTPVILNSTDLVGAKVHTMPMDMTEDNLELQTRGTTSYSSEGVIYEWTNGDQLVVFPVNERKKTSEFEEDSDKNLDGSPAGNQSNNDNSPNGYNPDGSPVENGNSNDNEPVNQANGEAVSTYTLVKNSQEDGGQAYFDGGGFKLDNQSNYFAFAPYIQKTIDGNAQPYVNINTKNKKDIRISYKGQRQVANKDNSHLNAYDYLASYGEVAFDTTANNTVRTSVNFVFKRVGRLIRIRVVTNDLAAGEERYYKRLEIRSKKDGFKFYPERTVDLTADADDPTKIEADTYHPVANTTVGDPGEDCYALDLGPEGGPGLKVETYDGTAKTLLVLYMMIPADDYSSEEFYGALIEGSGKEHYITLAGKDFTLDKAVSYGPTAVPAGQFGINVKVNKFWKLGTTTPQTRAKGDPGYDDNLEEPDHLYIYTFEGTTLTTIKAKKDQPAGGEWSKWEGWRSETGATVDSLWIYNGEGYTVNYSNGATNLKTYIIAYKGDYDLPTVSTEEAVKALTITCNGTDQEEDQAKLRNMYSNFYSVNPQVDKTKNCVAYHTAAKLDIQWNYTTALPTTQTVRVTNSPSTLNIFNPLKNTAGGVTYSTDITPGSMYNGRVVFYVPQITAVDDKVTYHVAIGAASDPTTKDDVVFTPTLTSSLTNSWTTWFKANIKK